MKTIIPVINGKCIADGFISTPDVCLYEMETSEREESLFKEVVEPGKGILSQFEEKKINGAIVAHIQLMALKVLSEKGFVVYKSDGRDLEHNLRLLKENKLKPFPPLEARENGTVCSGECDTCTEEEKK